jgi:hypothetical protein
VIVQVAKEVVEGGVWMRNAGVSFLTEVRGWEIGKRNASKNVYQHSRESLLVRYPKHSGRELYEDPFNVSINIGRGEETHRDHKVSESEHSSEHIPNSSISINSN